jgi:hypothetical protein
MSLCGNHPQSRKSTIRPTEDISRVQYCSPPSLSIGLSICMDLTAENTSESESIHFNFHCFILSCLLLKMLKHEWPIKLNVTPEVCTLVLVHEVPNSIESWSRSLSMRKCNHMVAVLSQHTYSLFLYKDYGRVLGTSKRTVTPLPIRIRKQRNSVPWCFTDLLADPFWHRNHGSSHPYSRKYGVSG